MELAEKGNNSATLPNVNQTPYSPRHDMHCVDAMGSLTLDAPCWPKSLGSSSVGYTGSDSPTISRIDQPDRWSMSKVDPYLVEEEVPIEKFFAIAQEHDESAHNYIQRWRNLTRRYKQPPCEEDVVRMCKHNLREEIFERTLPQKMSEDGSERTQPPRDKVECKEAKRTDKALQTYTCCMIGVVGQHGDTPPEQDELTRLNEGLNPSVRREEAKGKAPIVSVAQ
ncbi:hypothetical protein Taro_009174 [Colocasia esculenta]|uniref:Uncharacterized protein n=1 Tax=Colocasia esculenta TaxID=4460 RepID=A0A843U424_COLES|nr:hypothetical protein [Colocasia esculenta]